jgi:hypothetical protein
MAARRARRNAARKEKPPRGETSAAVLASWHVCALPRFALFKRENQLVKEGNAVSRVISMRALASHDAPQPKGR